jgi:hypothetical protein
MTKTKPLDDAWAKFNRARIHSRSLGRKIVSWAKAQGTRPIFRVHLDEDETAGCLVIKVRQVKRLAPTWSLLAGDALFNFRASLDYVAWQFVQVGANPNPKHPERVPWPIVAEEKDARGAMTDHLPGILPKHWALVEACQPYKTPGKLNPLSVLNELSRHDKHRHIVMISTAHKDYKIGSRVRYYAIERTETPSSGGALMLTRATELVRIYGKRTGDHDPKLVDVRLEGRTGVAFENGLWVLEVLAKIEDRIGNTLLNAESLF